LFLTLTAYAGTNYSAEGSDYIITSDISKTESFGKHEFYVGMPMPEKMEETTSS